MSKLKAEILGGGRKRKVDDAELEINVNAPEPPSKKAQRKAKKQKATDQKETESTAEDAALKRLDALEGERSKFGIWIGNLSFTTTKKDLYKFLMTNPDFPLSPQQITRIHLPASTDRNDQNKGFAYVDLANQDLVDTALKLSESLLGGRRLLIKDAKNFQGRPEITKPKIETPSRPPNRKIFVGNLDFDTTVEMLERHFGVCGQILRTQLATFEDSGKCKGYGWIEFESLFSAETAMRGWTEVHKPRKGADKKGEDGIKRVWLHRMADRKLRMKYAKDSTTRYTRRFGKNAISATSESAPEGNQEWDAAEHHSQLDVKQESKMKQTKNRVEKERRPLSRTRDSRYDKHTVQKLTGAIVEGKGNKVTFD